MFALQVYTDNKLHSIMQVEDMRDFAVSFKALARKAGYKKCVFVPNTFCNIAYKNKKGKLMTTQEYRGMDKIKAYKDKESTNG